MCAHNVKQVQVNEDSTHWRPIMLTWDKWEQPKINSASSGQVTASSDETSEQGGPSQSSAVPHPSTPSECNPDLPNEPLEGLRAGHKVN